MSSVLVVLVALLLPAVLLLWAEVLDLREQLYAVRGQNLQLQEHLQAARTRIPRPIQAERQ